LKSFNTNETRSRGETERGDRERVDEMETQYKKKKTTQSNQCETALFEYS